MKEKSFFSLVIFVILIGFISNQNTCPQSYEYGRVKYDKYMSPNQLLLIPQTNILIVLANDDQFYQPSVYYVIDTETNKVINAVEMVSTVYYIRYVPAIKSIIGINSSTFYVFDVYTMSIIQQAKVIDQGVEADNFIDTAIAVISSYKNIVVAYDIQQQRIINNYYSTYPINNFSCMTFPENKHLVFMNDNSYIVIWNVDTGENYNVIKNIFFKLVDSNLNTHFAHLQNSYYVLVVVNSTKLQLIDYSQYKQGQTNLLYTLDVLKKYNSVQFDSSQIVVKSMAISIQDQLQYNYLVVSHNGYQIIVFKMPKIFDKQSFQLQPIFASTIEFKSYIMPQNSLSFYLCGLYSINVVNFLNEVSPQFSQLLFFPSILMPAYPALSEYNQEVYISIFQLNVGMPNQIIFFQGSDQAGNQLFQTPYNYPFYQSYYSSQIVLNSNYGEIAYKIIYGGILIYNVSTQQYFYYNVLNSYNWSKEVSNYIIIKNTNSYSFIEVNHLDGGKSVMILDLITQQATYFYAPDQSMLGPAFTLSAQEQKLYAFNQQGTLHIWDFQGNHLSQRQISSVKVINMLKLQNLIAYVDNNRQLYQILDTEKTSKLIYQFSNVLTTFKYLDQINLIFAGEYQSGNIYGFKLNNNSYLLELFILLKTLISQSVLDISFTPITKLLYISAEYSNIYFDISQCIQDIKSCLSCQLKFYISNSQNQYVQYNSYGQGLQNYPYTTYQNMIQIFLTTQRYKKVLVNIKEIQTILHVNNKYPLELQQYILQFNFQNILSLSIQSYFDDSYQPSILYLEGDFSFNNFQSVFLGNITMIYNVTKNQNCSLNFNSIINQVILDNIQFQSNNMNDKDYCNSIKLVDSQLNLQNTILDSKLFSNLTFITSVGASKVRLSNFSLINSTLGLFTIFREQSHTLLEIDSLTIYQNQCKNQNIQNQEQQQSLFQAGKIQFSRVNISDNYFCNMQIIQIVAQSTIQNLQFNLNEIKVFNNQFKTLSQSILFSCLFQLLPQPDHQITIENIVIYNNKIIQSFGIQNNQQFFTSIVLTSNIQNITLNNINITDNHQIQFILSQESINFNLYNFNCSYSDTYKEKNKNYQSQGCLTIQEIFNINISNLNVFQKVAYDSNLVDITNQKIEQTNILIQDSSFSNIIIIQSEQYNQANPLVIKSSYLSNISINNCKFSNNILYGIPNSIALSSSGLQIINIVGNVIINESKFLHLTSNSDINALYILSPNIEINLSIFENTFYQQDQGLTSLNNENNISIKGGSINVKTQNLQINQCDFQKSLSYTGGFIFVSSYSKILKVNITESEFSDSFTKLNGGAFFLDSIGSTVQLILLNCQFKNIYLLNWQASLFYINQDTIGKNTAIKCFITINNVNFTDIYGEDLSSIFSLSYSQLNITKSYYTFNQNITFNEIIPLNQFNNFVPSTFISCIKSQININNLRISNIQDINSLTFEHQLFINSQNSDISLINCNISDIKMNLGGISQFNSDLVNIQNFQMHNIIFQSHNMLKRILQYQNNISCLRFSNTKLLVNQTNSSNIRCQYNCLGGFAYIGSSQLTLLNSNFSNIQSKNGGVFYIQDPNLNQFISNNIFVNNTSSLNGGVILIQSNQIDAVFNISIVKNYFFNNFAQSGKGGSIYYYSQNTSEIGFMILEENQILKNQAFIGGGINYEGIIPTLSDNIVENNSALLYGQNIFSYPTRLNLENSLELEQLNNQIQIKTNKIIISKQRSGGSLPMMIFTLKNEYNDIMKFADTEEIQNTYIILEIDSQIQYYEQYYLRGEPKAYYNQQTNNFQFKNIDLIGKPQSKVKLMVKSSLIRDNNTKQLTNNYYFEILVEILDCQKGQIKYKYNGFQECKICEQGTYSFDYNQCYKCPNGADCLGGSQIVVDQGFWRREEYDDNILSCENLKENCQGGSFGNLICYRGHIGALCEECDINGVFWGESYTKSGKYTCTECKKIQFNMYIVVFVTLWTMVSMVISVKSDSKKQTEIYKQELFSRIASKSTLKTKNQNKNNVDEYTSVYIKIFTNYLQIISSMASFNLKVPSEKRCNYNREQQLQQSQLIINNVTPNSDINLNGNQDTNHNQQLVITNPITSPGIELGLEKNVLLSAKRLLTDQIQSQNEEDYNQEFEERKEQDQCFSFRKYK
ncbi:hypothetical protein ABPG74_015063 [Tetrahymena malaccensis]